MSLIPDRPHSILPVLMATINKDLPISPRFTPYDFLSRCKLNQWLNLLTRVLTLSSTEERKQILETRIEPTTFALAGVQLIY